MKFTKLIEANKKRVFVKYFRNNWQFLILIVTAFMGFLWIKPGMTFELVGRGDFLSLHNIKAYLIYRTNAYDINRFFGIDSSPNLSQIFTYLGYFYLLRILNFPSTFSTGVFYYIIILVSSISFYLYLKKFLLYRFNIKENESIKIIMTSCSIIFSYSPVVISLIIPGHMVLLLAYAFFPYLLGVIEDIVNQKDSFWTYIKIFAVYFVIAPSFSNLGVLVVHNLGLAVYGFSILFLEKNIKNIITIIKKYLLAITLAMLANLWWILPSMITIPNKVARASNYTVINRVAPTSEFYSVANILLFKPYGIMHVDASLQYIHSSVLYLLISTILFVTPFYVFLCSKNKKQKKVIMLLVVLILFGIYLSKGYNPPFESIFVWLYENVTLFKIFRRSVSKFYWFVYVFQIVLFSLALVILWKDKKEFRKKIVFSAIFLSSIHLLNYNKFCPAIYYFDIPQYLKESTAYLAGDKHTYAYIPQDYPTQPVFNESLSNYSGRDIVDYIWDFRYTRPDIYGESLPSFQQKELGNMLYNLIHSEENNNENVCELTQQMGISHIVLRKNITNSRIDPEITNLMLQRLDIFDEVKKFGAKDDIIIYKLREDCSRDFIFSTKGNLSKITSYGKSFFFVEFTGGGKKDLHFMTNYSKNWLLIPSKLETSNNSSIYPKGLFSLMISDIKGEGIIGLDDNHIYWDISEDLGNSFLVYYKPQIYFYLGGIFTLIAASTLAVYSLVKKLGISKPLFKTYIGKGA